MVLTVKHKFSIYRRFEVDIWGLALTATANFWELYKNKYIRFFYKLHSHKRRFQKYNQRRYVYRIDQSFRFFRRKKWNLRFMSVRLTRYYYLTLKDYHFRKYFRKAGKLSGQTEMNYCRFIEGRLVSIFYRTNYMYNIFEIINFVRNGNVLINFKPVSYINQLVPLGSFLTIKKEHQDKLNKGLHWRLKRKSICFNVPSFLFISYRCGFFYLLRYPLIKDLVYPFRLDIQRLTGYY